MNLKEEEKDAITEFRPNLPEPDPKHIMELYKSNLRRDKYWEFNLKDQDTLLRSCTREDLVSTYAIEVLFTNRPPKGMMFILDEKKKLLDTMPLKGELWTRNL